MQQNSKIKTDEKLIEKYKSPNPGDKNKLGGKFEMTDENPDIEGELPQKQRQNKLNR